MKKSKPRKSPAQIAQELAEKQTAKTAVWHSVARKFGEAVRFTFTTAIRRALGCEFSEAEKVFEAAVSAGEIEKTRTNAVGDVVFYRLAKKS